MISGTDFATYLSDAAAVVSCIYTVLQRHRPKTGEVDVLGSSAMGVRGLWKIWGRWLPPLVAVVAVSFGYYDRHFLEEQQSQASNEVKEPQSPSGSESLPSRLIMPAVDLYRLAPWLGMAKTEVISSTHAAIVSHENAFLLFMLPMRNIVRLDSNHKFSIYEDRNTDTSSKMYEDAYLKAMLGSTLPDGCSPPKGGSAVLWKDDPQLRTIGCRQWFCDISGPSVKYQVFESGLVIVGFPHYRSLGQGVTYILRSTLAQPLVGTWDTTGSALTIPTPECPA